MRASTWVVDGTRKDMPANLTAIPLLIADDLRMRKLPHTHELAANVVGIRAVGWPPREPRSR